MTLSPGAGVFFLVAGGFDTACSTQGIEDSRFQIAEQDSR
jgi:hypothetical protein